MNSLAAGTFVLFAADLGDIIPAIVGLLFVIIPVIGQLLGNANKKNQPGGRPGGANPPANPGVDKEVADFLRRVAQNQEKAKNAPNAAARPQGQQAAHPAQPRPAQSSPARGAGRELPPRPGVRQPQKPRGGGRGVSQPPLPAQVVAEETPKPIQQAADRLGTSERFGSRSRLGKDVDAELQKQERRRRKSFSRNVDSLKDHHLEGTVAPKSQETAATQSLVGDVDWAAMLGNVENVRQAIVLGEVLQRPEHRWL